MAELLTLTGLGIFAMFAEIFRVRKIIFPAVLLGLLAFILVCILNWNGDENLLGKNMMLIDNYARSFSVIFSLIAFLWFLMAESYFTDETNLSDHFALALFALVGGFCLVSFTDLSMLFIGVEILSIPMYVLAGSRKRDVLSNEAAFKYFLMGSFASGFLLFGIAFIYGATGSLYLPDIAQYVQHAMAAENLSALFSVGVFMMIIAMGFKVAIMPFHFWTPDVYQGAPTVVTAFMATIVKTVAFAAFFRLFIAFLPFASKYGLLLWAGAAITMLAGNIIGAAQLSAKRMLAWSSVGHAGFMLIPILTMTSFSDNAILYYTAAYSVASIAAFAVLFDVATSNGGNEGISAFRGLARKEPLLAGSMTLALLSMAGIPPLSGFFAKYFIFKNALESGYFSLVIVGIISSLIGVYYYFKIIITMFFDIPSSQIKYQVSPIHRVLLMILSALIVLLGIFPNIILDLIG